MEVWHELSKGERHTLLRAKPDEYDAVPPIDAVRLGIRLRSANRNRMAVGLALLFGRFCSYSYTPRDGCSPAVAKAISDFFHTRQILVANQQFKPELIPTGIRPCYCVTSDVLPKRSFNDGAVFVSIASTQSTTSFLSVEEVRLHSNANLLKMSRNDTLPLLGVAAILADDLEIRNIYIDDQGQFDDTMFKQGIQRLFAEVNINLQNNM